MGVDTDPAAQWRANVAPRRSLKVLGEAATDLGQFGRSCVVGQEMNEFIAKSREATRLGHDHRQVTIEILLK